MKTALHVALAWATLGAPATSAETIVAVAANFAEPAEKVAAVFNDRSGDRVILSFGATGALYAQITQGAPFSALLAADSARPQQAIEEGFGVAGTAFTYAIGRLTLYGPTLEMADGEAVLRAGAFSHIAIAEPNAAPYGAAAMETLTALGAADLVASKLVVGENVSQALQFVESGNAELGFVALSQVVDRPAAEVWVVPAHLHAPILQDAVLLAHGETDAVATAFLGFLRSEEAREIIGRYGYELPAEGEDGDVR